MTQNEGKNIVLSILYIIAGIWTLFWGFPAFLTILHYILYNRDIPFEVYPMFFFHIILVLLLFAGAYYLYKDNKKFIVKISYAIILTSITYLLIRIIELIIFGYAYFFQNLGLFLMIYIIPVLLVSILALWHIKKTLNIYCF